MQRGFKAWCERTAADYRGGLGVPLDRRLDPIHLAETLGVRVLTPEHFPGLSEQSRKQLRTTDPYGWSAVTISRNGARLIVVNPAHSAERRANNLAHELAHLILNHAPEQIGLSDEGVLMRLEHDPEQEDEADWLAGCLLAPREGLRRAYARNRSVEALAGRFGVSIELIRWRLASTGVTRQVRARRG